MIGARRAKYRHRAHGLSLALKVPRSAATRTIRSHGTLGSAGFGIALGALESFYGILKTTAQTTVTHEHI